MLFPHVMRRGPVLDSFPAPPVVNRFGAHETGNQNGRSGNNLNCPSQMRSCKTHAVPIILNLNQANSLSYGDPKWHCLAPSPKRRKPIVGATTLRPPLSDDDCSEAPPLVRIFRAAGLRDRPKESDRRR